MTRIARFAALLSMVMLTSGCALSLRNPKIADLRYNPGRYQNHTVSVEGVVTSAYGVPMAPFKVYKVDDGTGELTVLSQGSRMPTRGARVRVKGRVDELAVLGGQAFGLHMREESLYVKNR